MRLLTTHAQNGRMVTKKTLTVGKIKPYYKHVKHLPKSLTRVTGFSKTLALLLILAFLGAAFFAGIVFQREAGKLAGTLVPTPTPFPSAQTLCSSDSDCLLVQTSETSFCCPNTKCMDLSQEEVQAVSLSWEERHRKDVCTGTMCPMIAALCTRQITEENSHYHAKCLQHVCQKVRE